MEKPDDIFADGKEIFAGSHHRELDPIVRLLAEHGIPHTIVAPGSKFNPNYAFAKNPDSIRLIVPAAEYEKARTLLVEQGWIVDVSESEAYREMLQDLEDEDLMEIVVDALRYDAGQVAMARVLLKERGKDVSEDAIKSERVRTASEQRESLTIKPIWIFLWVMFSFLGPPVGAFVSLGILRGSGKDVNGETYYFYDERYRATAKILLVISTGIIILSGLAIGFSKYIF